MYMEGVGICFTMAVTCDNDPAYGNSNNKIAIYIIWNTYLK